MSNWLDRVSEIDKHNLDKSFANIFYSTGVPFRFADSPALTTFMQQDGAHRRMMQDINQFLHDKPIVSLVSDGWTSLRNDHMVNFVAVFPLKSIKPVFLKAISTGETSQTAINIAAELKRAIMEIGSDKVASVVTDNAACMKAAWKLLENDFPGLICNGCAAHAINLLIKDVCKLEMFSATFERAREVTNFVKDRNAVTKRFERIQQVLFNDGEVDSRRSLSTVVSTRWYTHYNCLKRVLDNKKVINQLVDSTFFAELKASSTGKGKKAAFVSAVTDAEFWTQLAQLESLLRPTSKIIGMFEADTCCLSDVYRLFLTLRSHWHGDAQLTELLLGRWAFLHTESMGFAYFLDPSTRAGEGMFEDDLYDNS